MPKIVRRKARALDEIKYMKYSAGDWVQVRSKSEILKTLDEEGRLDMLPFMPEMFAYCGKRFRVFKRAHKTCDPVFTGRGRRMNDTVHLDVRCDGQAHGGCQASCLIFWKLAWLVSATEGSNEGGAAERVRPAESGSGCTEADVNACTLVPKGSSKAVPCYSCQATALPKATSPLPWWDIRQYVEDYWSGNVGLWRIIKGFTYAGYYNLSQSGLGLGRSMRWLYDKLHPLWRGTLFPRHLGTVCKGESTPTGTLDLQPGEWVRVKSYQAILATCDAELKNRGMKFDAEMVPYCGSSFRVLKRVSRLIDEKTGTMQEIKNPCIILDTVVCQSRYSNCRMFCPRSIYPYWREVWLERVQVKELVARPDLALAQVLPGTEHHCI